ncbi:MAG: DEAD/DEAH box helicase [Alphaproteobacteria bacterium]|nr:DEAD/DEAH box helicase [Alphaproteobacteria bacterium]
MTQFSDLGLAAPLLSALASIGHTVPTPIQSGAIPTLLNGHDLIGIAQTGTGKTAAFGLPMLQRLTGNPIPRRAKRPRALILAPTRELASQIGDSLKQLSQNLQGVRIAVVFGGVGYRPQTDALARGVDILVACPGRLLDLIEQKACDITGIEILVLDEADRMLDMGFIHAIRRIVALVPKERQTLLFSATMPTEIAGLAKAYLRNPERVEVTPQATTVEKIDQQVIHIDHARKSALLAHLLGDPAMARAIVFTRTKHGANRVADRLEKQGITASAIHGNKSQTAREKALAGFRAGDLRVLVATDLAARGIDVQGISHVVNFDLPHEPESYVHRIGRTARAGASGTAIAFCAPDERSMLKAIERTTRQAIPVLALPAFVVPAGHAMPPITREEDHRQPRQPRRKQRNGSANNGHQAHQGQKAHPGQKHRARKPAPRHQSPSRPQGGGGGGIGDIGFLRAAAPRGQDR